MFEFWMNENKMKKITNAQRRGLKGLEYELRCPLCKELFKDPVSTDCEHKFCKECVMDHLDDKSACPQCNLPLMPMDLTPNKVYQNLVENFKLVRHFMYKLDKKYEQRTEQGELEHDQEEEEEEDVKKQQQHDKRPQETVQHESDQDEKTPQETMQHDSDDEEKTPQETADEEHQQDEDDATEEERRLQKELETKATYSSHQQDEDDATEEERRLQKELETKATYSSQSTHSSQEKVIKPTNNDNEDDDGDDDDDDDEVVKSQESVGYVPPTYFSQSGESLSKIPSTPTSHDESVSDERCIPATQFCPEFDQRNLESDDSLIVKVRIVGIVGVERDHLVRDILRLGGLVVDQDNIGNDYKTVSHVVVNQDAVASYANSPGFVLGLMNGSYIVSARWVHVSVTAEEWVNERPFVVDPKHRNVKLSFFNAFRYALVFPDESNLSKQQVQTCFVARQVLSDCDVEDWSFVAKGDLARLQSISLEEIVGLFGPDNSKLLAENNRNQKPLLIIACHPEIDDPKAKHGKKDTNCEICRRLNLIAENHPHCYVLHQTWILDSVVNRRFVEFTSHRICEGSRWRTR